MNDELSYKGSSYVTSHVYSGSQTPVHLIQRALDVQGEIVTQIAKMKIVSTALQHAAMCKNDEALDRILVNAMILTDDAITEIQTEDVALRKWLPKNSNVPGLLPLDLYQSLQQKVSELNEALEKLKLDPIPLTAIPTLANSGIRQDLVEGEMKFLSELGAEGGHVNLVHEKLITMMQKAQAHESIRVSKRLVIASSVLEDQRVKGFIQKWEAVKAEAILDNTSGSNIAGVLISKTENGIEFQVQVGAVSGHAMVIKDDGNVTDLSYWDHSQGRRGLLRAILKEIGLEPSLKSGTSVTATGKSSVENFYFLAKIIPNLIDMDFCDGFSDNKAAQAAAVQAILLGYPVTLLQGKKFTSLEDYTKLCQGANISEICKRSGKFVGTSDPSANQPKQTDAMLREFSSKGGEAIGGVPFATELSKVFGKDEAAELLKFSKKFGKPEKPEEE